MDMTINFSAVTMKDLPQVGGKNASLGEMINKLSALDIKIPRGFATTANAYRDFLQENQLSERINKSLQEIDVDNVQQLQQKSASIREWILNASLPKSFAEEVKKAYRELNLSPEHTVAVRSSATAEDLPTASFAGQQETYLNVTGEKNILDAIKRVYASLFTERAIAYRVHHNFKHNQVAISVGIQQMIRSDKASSGVIFSIDTESGFDQVVFITAAYGLGEAIVQGTVNPDEFYVYKPTLNAGKKSLISRKLGDKSIKMVYSNGRTNKKRIKTVKVPKAEQLLFCLTDDEVLELARQAIIIEKHYGRPMDIEWAKDGIDKQLYIIQARPETVKNKEKHQTIKQYRLTEKSTPIISGRSIGQKIGQGVARLIKTPKQMAHIHPGEILVTDMTDPDWEPIMKKAAAIVTNRGGRTCHAAIVARELGIPAVIGCKHATESIKDGENITVSCAEGETGFIYPGLLKYEIDETALNELPKIPVKLCMNLANPEQAFSYQYLPNDGVGLARMEFIISNMIGIHPNALLHLDKLPKDLQDKIKKQTAAYKEPKEFYIEKLAEGIATISAAFYPKQVIVRFSDFKSNEYANLLGGHYFEPKEENPMLGYRGAARYTSEDFRDCFALECEAIKRVRNDKGLTNTQIMLPFVRTLQGLNNLIILLESEGLKRGQDGLKLYMMCEIPSNAILADEFLKQVDGYSIGSNDLTQLTLGLDRDSELIANLFDERDPAVKALLKLAIDACNKVNKYVGICGQGPSDHPSLAKWLMEQGIQSMSLSPDSIVRTWLMLAKKN